MATPPEKVETQIVTEDAPASGKQDVTPQQLAIVGGVVLVVLIGLVYFFVLRGDGEEELPPPPVAEGIPAPEDTPAPVDEGIDDDDDDDGRIETFEVFAPRDPFEPLISAASGAAGGGGDTTADGDTGTDGDATTDPDGTTDGDPQPDGESIGDHRVKVIDVYTQNGQGRAQIQVDGTVYTVDEGEGFADNFRLVSTSGSCATILFGDDEFTLCEGEEILK